MSEEDMMNDPEIAAMVKAQRKRKLMKVGIAVAVVVVGAAAILPSGGSVASALEEEGYTDVKVERSGVFDFKWTAKKGDSACSGSFKKMPGSTSRNSFCSSASGEVDVSGS